MIDIPLEKDPGSKSIERVKGNVEFKNVWYKYPNALESSLKDFTLKAEAGKMIAFVGASGAGKSTIINMIPRFMVPTKGEILFDGIPQNEMTLESIRRQVAIVTQEVMLFDDTIAANIAFGAGRPVTEEEIKSFVYDNINLPYLRFYYRHFHISKKVEKEPLIVSNNQIESLRIICKADADDIIVSIDEVQKFQKGQAVRIVEGKFKGVTGIVARYQEQQRVGIVIDGLLTMVTAYIPNAFIEVVKK